MSSIDRMGADYCQPGHEGGTSVTVYGSMCVTQAVSIDQYGRLASDLETFVVWGASERQRDAFARGIRLRLNGSLN